MIGYFKYEQLVLEAIEDQIKKYKLCVSNVFSEGIDIENNHIRVHITFRYGEYNLSLINIRSNIRIGLNDIILAKYPNYFDPESKDSIFSLDEQNFKTIELYFQYLVKTSFDFIENNFPDVFLGKF